MGVNDVKESMEANAFKSVITSASDVSIDNVLGIPKTLESSSVLGVGENRVIAIPKDNNILNPDVSLSNDKIPYSKPYVLDYKVETGNDSRPSKDDTYLNMAYSCALRGTCLRRNYGSVIVKDDRVIGTGYTGAPRGRKNCCDLGTCIRQQKQIPRGERYELCIVGDTKIKLNDRPSETIKTLCEDGTKAINVLSYNYDRIIPVHTKPPIKIGEKVVIKIKFSDNTILKCTPDHKILLTDNTFKAAKDLKTYDNIMGYREESCNGSLILTPIAKRVIKVDDSELYPETVYDITNVEPSENFAVDLGNGTGVFIHNCRSVHSEMNAIINSAPDELKDSTLYLVGVDKETGNIVENASCCSMCKRAVINAGIKTVVVRDVNGNRKVNVNDWIINDDSLSDQLGY